jgi:hypothetical protein
VIWFSLIVSRKKNNLLLDILITVFFKQKLNIYLFPGYVVRFPRKVKTSLVKGWRRSWGNSDWTTYVSGAQTVTVERDFWVRMLELHLNLNGLRMMGFLVLVICDIKSIFNGASITKLFCGSH